MLNLFLLIATFLISYNAHSAGDLLGLSPEMIKGRLIRGGQGIQFHSERAGLSSVALAHYQNQILDSSNYNLNLRFNLKSGSDSFGFALPIGRDMAQVVLGGWKGKHSGLGQIDGVNLNNKRNATYSNAGFQFGQVSTFRLEVRPDNVKFIVNGVVLSQVDPRKHNFELHRNIENRMPSDDRVLDDVLLWMISGELDVFEFSIESGNPSGK